MRLCKAIRPLLLSAITSSVLGDPLEVPEYDCFMCAVCLEHAMEQHHDTLLGACESLFSPEVCGEFPIVRSDLDIASITKEKKGDEDGRELCRRFAPSQVCSDLSQEAWRDSSKISPHQEGRAANMVTDVRVAKGYGSRGYPFVRVSVISDQALSNDTISQLNLDYSQQFKYRWTDKYLSSGVYEVTPGEPFVFEIGGEQYSIVLPPQGAGVRGTVIADPCFTNEFVWCSFGEKLDTLNRSTLLLNAINAHDDAHFWSVLGDNFYDLSGEPSSAWFAELSTATKSKVFGSVPGNHDFWIFSAPRVWMKRDQLANGFMQFYGQDVAAGVENEANGSKVPFNFTNDPDSEDTSAYNIPTASNFFYYHMMGNLGIISYSGAHSYDEMLPYFVEACVYLDSQQPSAVLLQGHWNTQGLGCPSEMNVPETYEDLLKVPECQGIANKMRYVMGHLHCNKVVEEDVGFMVAGQGMTANENFACNGNFGLPIVDTTGGNFSIYYFDVAQVDQYDNFDEIYDCISAHGVSNCYHLAKEWTNVPF